MVGCILTGHGKFSEGLSSALEMIGGPQEDFQYVVFLEDEAAEYPQRLRDAISDMVNRCGECLVFCDLVGGTPFNQAMLASADMCGVEVVAGANLPMLLESVCGRDDSMSVAELAQTAELAGKLGVAYKKLESCCDDNSDDDCFEGGI